MSTKIKTSTGWKTVAECGAAAPHSYSTNEQKTGGYWIDGKPIYRKVVTGLSVTVNQGGDWVTVCTIPNAESLVSYRMKVANNQDWSSNVLCMINSSGNVRMYNCTGLNCTVNTVIIEYTKTTD